MRYPNRSDTNRTVQARTTDRGWKLWIKNEEEMYRPYTAKIKALMNFAVTTVLICTIVSECTTCWFSNDKARLVAVAG